MMDMPRGQRACPIPIPARAAAGLSLARAHHLRSGAGTRRLGRRNQRRRRRRSAFASSRRTIAASFCITPISCDAAGGVDAFLIGSELVGLTRVRSASGVYPAVRGVADARRRRERRSLGDGDEDHLSAPTGPNMARMCRRRREVRFPLDPLWASPAIDFVGIDDYSPLSDWRDGAVHLDAAIAAERLRSRLSRARASRAGEGYDWYLRRRGRARGADAHADHRRRSASPGCSGRRISGPGGRNPHHERVGGAELGAPTAWTPQSKPIWLTETGCPAVDQGANAPNVFPDAQIERGRPAAFLARRARRSDAGALLEAMLAHFDPAAPGGDARNPVSPVYGGRDGRSGAHPSLELGRAAVSGLSGADRRLERRRQLGDRPLAHRTARRRAARSSRRSTLAARLEIGDFASSVRRSTASSTAMCSTGRCRRARRSSRSRPIRSTRRRPTAALASSQRRGELCARSARTISLPRRTARWSTLTRAQETELPHEIALSFADRETDYRQRRVLSRRLEGYRRGVARRRRR